VNDSKVRSRLKAQLTKFSDQLWGGLSKPLGKFVAQMLYGIQSSQDVKLSNIGRALGEAIPLIRTEKRLSRNLKHAELEEELTNKLVEMASARIQQDTVLALDLSDIRKEYAQKMEHLATVWDGSSGETHPGYWLVDVAAAEVAAGCRLSHQARVVKIDKGQEKTYDLHYGAEPFRLVGRDQQLWLAVVAGFGEQPILLVTNLKLRARDSESVCWAARIYWTKWNIEETFRFVKQSYNLEDIRVMNYRRLKNSVVLLTAMAYFAATYLGQQMKLRILAEKLLVISQRFFALPPFRFHALADGIRRLLSGSVFQPPQKLPPDAQLERALIWPA
jgi:hypothetical protein